MRCVVAFLVALMGLFTVVGAMPQVITSLASQRAPVARVGQDYLFTVLPDTFKSDTATVNYTTSLLPTWLTFSATNPTFYGNPTANDVGEHVVTLFAVDSTGSANSTVTLIVSNFTSPIVNMAFDQQLADPSSRNIASAKVMPGNHGISVPPYWSFALGWNGNTFKMADSNNNGKLYYSAHLRGTTGLPNWLQFSNTTFTFNGVAPANGTYEVVVTGTDYWNYTAATSSFVFSVGTGLTLENSKSLTDLKTVARNILKYPLDLSGILLNGQKLDPAQINATPDLSELKWLSYNNTTRTISGTTPDSLVNGTVAPYTVPVTLSSTNDSNTISYVSYLNISVLPYSFTTFQLPTTEVTAGQTFQFDVSKFLVNHSTSALINASVIPGTAAPWLLYYPDNYTLSGTPPTNITYSAINVTFKATSDGVTSTTNVTIPIRGITGPQGEGEPAPIPIALKKGGLSTKNKIIIGVVVGVVGLLILLGLLLFCCCYRKRKSRAADETSKPKDAEKEGSPDTLLNTPNPKSPVKGHGTKGNGSVDNLGDSPQRRFGIKGLFGTVDEPTLPTTSSKDSSVSSPIGSGNSSFVGAGEFITVNDPIKKMAQSRPAPNRDSLASWESETVPSMHWSGEDEYLEPLYEREGFVALCPIQDLQDYDEISSAAPGPSTITTPTFGPEIPTANDNSTTPTFGPGVPAVNNNTLADSHRPRIVWNGHHLPSLYHIPGPEGNIPRPRAGFHPSYPRWIEEGDQFPALSSDNASLHFSEFDHENSDRNMVTSRTLVTSQSLDSFAGQGSELVGTSSGSRISKHSQPQMGGEGAWWKSSNLSSAVGRSSYSSGEQAIVATAHRQSLDTQRSSVVPNEIIDFSAPRTGDYGYGDDDSEAEEAISFTGDHSPAISAVTPTTPTRPVSYLVVPSYVRQTYTPPKYAATAHRQSSSRRSPAHGFQTRENIMRDEPQGEVVYSAPLNDQRGQRHYRDNGEQRIRYAT